MATKKQIDFFDQLLDEKDFGDKETSALRDQFSELNDSSASAWIESAIQLPKKDTTQGKDAPPPF
jgi:hypothetical protein